MISCMKSLPLLAIIREALLEQITGTTDVSLSPGDGFAVAAVIVYGSIGAGVAGFGGTDTGVIGVDIFEVCDSVDAVTEGVSKSAFVNITVIVIPVVHIIGYVIAANSVRNTLVAVVTVVDYNVCNNTAVVAFGTVGPATLVYP